jgi:GDP-L-fucose synthase
MPKYFVLGHDTLLGRTFVNRLCELGHIVSSCNSECSVIKVDDYDYVVHAGGPTMGISGNNKYPADLMVANLQSALRLVTSLPLKTKTLYLASSCCYPPMCDKCHEEDFGRLPLEPISSYYATAKIAAVKLCQAHRKQHNSKFICAVPTNVFGPQDDVRPESSHVIMGIMAKLHVAKKNNLERVMISGTGSPVRELMYAPDAVNACLFLLDNYDGHEVVNVASGVTLTIKQIVDQLAAVIGYNGRFIWDITKPDGAPYKALARDKLLCLGWKEKLTPMKEAFEKTYAWYSQFVESETDAGGVT